jgi:hypothetical protein
MSKRSREELIEKYIDHKVWTFHVPPVLDRLLRKPDKKNLTFFHDGAPVVHDSFSFIEGTLIGYHGTTNVALARKDISLSYNRADVMDLANPGKAKYLGFHSNSMVWNNVWLADIVSIVVDDPFDTPKKVLSAYPHKCPACKNRAVIMFSTIECTGIGCRYFKLERGL